MNRLIKWLFTKDNYFFLYYINNSTFSHGISYDFIFNNGSKKKP